MSERRILCRVGWVLIGLLLISSIRAFVHMVQSHSIVDEYIGVVCLDDLERQPLAIQRDPLAAAVEEHLLAGL